MQVIFIDIVIFQAHYLSPEDILCAQITTATLKHWTPIRAPGLLSEENKPVFRLEDVRRILNLQELPASNFVRQP